MTEVVGLIAGNGVLPALVAKSLKAKGFSVHAVAHRGETDTALAQDVDSMAWVHVGQLGAIAESFVGRGVRRATMAGGIGRNFKWTKLRPDRGAFKAAMGVRRFTDDALLRHAAQWLGSQGITLVPATEFVEHIAAGAGLLAGPPLSRREEEDVRLGFDVARLLGQADVGQSVVVKEGMVLAVEALEGTDACIRRAAELGGKGAVVVKRFKPHQDVRFDVPAVGSVTLEVMREAGARVLAIEAHRTLLLDAETVFRWAPALGISVLGVDVGTG